MRSAGGPSQIAAGRRANASRYHARPARSIYLASPLSCGPPFAPPIYVNRLNWPGEAALAGDSMAMTPEETIRLQEDRLHDGFCAALIGDFRTATRYVALAAGNEKTYSIEFVRLLLDICSEVDALAKLHCERRRPGSISSIDRPTIAHWGEGLREMTFFPSISMHVDRQWLVQPWVAWKTPRPDGIFASPPWWDAYNRVKHDRSAHFKDANQENVLDAICGLAALCYVAIPDSSSMWQTPYIRRHS